ncbi:MAG: hypothetical protein ACREU3_07100 [Steroidobacteraceae bacterium]
MASVLVALYDDHATAERVRTALVQDGFPTDRVQLTSCREPGTAGMIAAQPATERFREYFESLFDSEAHLRHARFLAGRVRDGAATITVHPRGEREISRALELLEREAPLVIDPEHLEDTRFEQAASAHDRPYLLRVIQGSDRRAPEG